MKNRVVLMAVWLSGLHAVYYETFTDCALDPGDAAIWLSFLNDLQSNFVRLFSLY